MTEALEKLLKEQPALYKAILAQVSAEKSLYKFTEMMWEFVEPSNPFVPGWHMEVICEHLEAVTRGEILRLLINVPPGMSKSLLLNVFWPAWEWLQHPNYRYIATSYSQSLTERDNIRFRQIITSDLYKATWGDRFGFSRDSFSVIKVGNDKTGWKLATSTKGVGTGERGDRVLVDDPHNVAEGESELVMKSTLQYFTETLPTRLNHPISSAIVVIMQRVAENDISGHIISNDLGYDHILLPMEYDPAYPKISTSIGFVDPREEPGQLLFPARFPDWVVEREKKIMGPYASAAQFQQSPSPRGGGIIKRDYWQIWPPDTDEKFGDDGNPIGKLIYPAMDVVIASVDTAFTENQENDPSALSILGVIDRPVLTKSLMRTERFDSDLSGTVYDAKAVLLMNCWQKRLEFRGQSVARLDGEDERSYKKRRQKHWGLLEWVAYECARWKVDFLLIENKASGITLGQEIRKVYANEKWNTLLIDVRGDKVLRINSIQHIFAEKMVYAPNRDWAEMCIAEFEKFPKGKHDDVVDATGMGIKWLRDRGYLSRRDETRFDNDAKGWHIGKQDEALYDV